MEASRVLLLVGIAIVSVGVVIGTGAFTTVSAERTVSVDTAGDAAALVGLEPGSGGAVDGRVTAPGGQVEITLPGDSADGINEGARTEFQQLVRVTNNGGQNVTSLSFDIDADADRVQYITNTTSTEYEEDENVLDRDIAPGEAVEFGLVFDLRDGGFSGGPDYTVSINASTTGGS
jgi:hypothetical protein